MAEIGLQLAVNPHKWPYFMEKPNKMSVIRILSEQTMPLSMSEILKLLGSHYNERTVRRWLTELASLGLIQKTGKKSGIRYAKATDYQETAGVYNFSPQSREVIDQIQQPLFQRKPVSYNFTWLENYIPNQTNFLNESEQADLYTLGKRAKNHAPSGTYAHHIYNRLLIDLSYNSSRLEGNTYSLLETKRLLFEGISATDKLDEEKIMILNHKEAIRYIVDNSERIQINEIDLLTLHFLLADGLVPTQYAGKIRDYSVRISSSAYIPLENLLLLKNQFNLICEKAASIDNPHERSLFLLVHLSYLQAFIDVNKRTARLSANIPLIQANLVPLSFNDIERTDYINAMLAVYELNDLTPLKELYVFSYSRTCAMYDATIESAGFDDIRIRYRQERRNLLRYIILNKLHGKNLENYIEAQTQNLVPKEHRSAFIEDIYEDLKLLSPARIAGLGISIQQLNDFLKG